MIFVKLDTEQLVQEGDKTRLDLRRSFVSSGTASITKYEIEPSALAGFIDVTNNMYLDMVYGTTGDMVVSARLTDSDLNEYTSTITISVISSLEDNLFSTDRDILSYEPDLLGYVQDGRFSFIDKHRAAQKEILNELDANRIWKLDGSRYKASDIVDLQEFKEWSKFLTLRIIFEGLSNAVDDVFKVKATRYNSLATTAKKRSTLRLDVNQDGVQSEAEKVDLFTGTVVRA